MCVQAFDLVSLHEVACKIHQVNSQWSEVKKVSYVKHTVREYEIHRSMKNPRLVGGRGVCVCVAVWKSCVDVGRAGRCTGAAWLAAGGDLR